MKTVSDDILKTWSKYAKTYDPIKCASIDGTDIEPHDRAVVRALNSTYKPNRFVKGRPECTIFVSRLNHETSKDTIKDIFSKYGKLKRFRMVKDIVTSMPKGYAFVEYEEEQAAEDAYRLANKMVVDGRVIFVDFECERLLRGWKPRRLGGGFGGKKESGQLRFGGRDRPFKKPIALELKEQEERRRREKERRLHEEERRRRDKRRSPVRENGVVASRNKKKHDSRDREKRPLSPRSGSPPRKVARRHSPSKQIDKLSESRNSQDIKVNPREEVKVHLEESKQRNSSPKNNKTSKPCLKETSTKEQAKQKSSAKEHARQKSPIREQAKQKSSPARSNSKQIPTSNTLKAKHPAEKRHHSPPRQSGRPQTPPERYKRSPPRNPYRSRSPERGSDKRRSPVGKYENRPPPARERGRSISPHHNVQYRSVGRDDDRRNQNFRGESPQRKLGRKRHSPIQSFSERYPSGRDRVPVSPSRVYSPVNRDRYSPSRRSPARRYSPSRPENIRGHYDDAFPHDRKRDAGAIDVYPKQHGHTTGRHSPYNDHLPSRGYQEHFEYNNRSHYSSTHREREFLLSHTDLRQYSPPRVDLRQPPPSYEPPRDYTSYRDMMAVPPKETNPYRDLHPDIDRYALKAPHESRYLPISRDGVGEHQRHFSPEPQPKRHYISSKEEISRYDSRPSDTERIKANRRGAARGGRGGFRRN